jgi:membrane-associated phospholipid phosphatase
MSRLSFAMFPLRLWLLPLLLIALAAPLWLHVWEPAMFLALNHWCMPVAAQVWTGLSMLGNGWAILALASPLLLFAPRLMWAVLCAAPFAVLFARSGKLWIVSPRPAAEIDNTQIRIVGEVLHNVSMPSGHTTTAFAVATGLFFALTPQQRSRHFWIVLLALGTGVSRIAVGAHWPGDVSVGIGLGLWAGLLGNVLLAQVPARWCDPAHWSMRAVALLMACAVYVLLTDQIDFDENEPAQWVLAALASLALLVFARRSARSLKAR